MYVARLEPMVKTTDESGTRPNQADQLHGGSPSDIFTDESFAASNSTNKIRCQDCRQEIGSCHFGEQDRVIIKKSSDLSSAEI